jgi:hypothetical protein
MKLLKKHGATRLHSMTVRIPAALADEVREVKAEAKRAELDFPVAEVVAEALRSALQIARKDLSALDIPPSTSLEVLGAAKNAPFHSTQNAQFNP